MRRRIPKYFPGWFVSGGGGSGGSGTVQTDGVTIQGDGSAGNKIAILAVQLAARLTGAGTVASPLDIAGWPLPFVQPFYAQGGLGLTANKIALTAWVIPHACIFSKIAVNIATADNANNNDLGLYNAAGTLIANIGAQHIAGTGSTAFATVQGSQTISPGIYFFAATSAASTLGINQMFTQAALYFSGSFGTSAGGALPNSITPPAYSVAQQAFGFTLF